MIGDLINSQNISWHMQVNGKRIRFLIVINVKGQTGHLYEKFMSQVWMVGYINLVQWNLDLRKPDIRKNLDLRKIVATTDFLVHKMFDLRKIF